MNFLEPWRFANFVEYRVVFIIDNKYIKRFDWLEKVIGFENFGHVNIFNILRMMIGCKFYYVYLDCCM
jgi:hypothetical protein